MEKRPLITGSDGRTDNPLVLEMLLSSVVSPVSLKGPNSSVGFGKKEKKEVVLAAASTEC